MRHPSKIIVCAALLAGLPATPAQELLDTLDDSLYLQSANGFVRTDLSALLDLEGYYIDQNPPGLIFADDELFFNPRLSLYLDTTIGQHLYSLVQVRFDRGFDPGSQRDGAARVDEYLLRYTPLDAPVVNFQVGKFATVFGSWVERHDSWNNPFINAPVPYENITIITDQAAPPSRAGFLGRKARPDQKPIWVPMIWGPSYALGASIFGRIEQYDYAVEIKNASLSSRPAAWDEWEFDHPTVSGRFGVRPNASWNIGANASYGAYLQPAASETLPAGRSLGDYTQLTVGPDVGFAWRHLQLWAEAYASRFEVPTVGDAETVAYYLEAKYKLDAQWFTALRWSQQFFDEVTNAAGDAERWYHDLWRAEAALGYRYSRHLQAKLQYSYTHQNGPIQQGEQLVATQVTLKF